MHEEKLSGAVDLIRTSHDIVVFTGAGISTNSGIPDFRGPKGLYTQIGKRFNLPYPEAIFDIEYFVHHPEPFFQLAKDLLTQRAEPTLCHRFLAWLEKRGKLSLVMTQNFDMLHSLAGSKKVLECHGTLRTAHCMKCRKPYSVEDIEQPILAGEIPHCKCGGIIKPDIVFFGESLPPDFYTYLERPPKADMILVLGTSLNVQPAATFALRLVSQVPSVMVNLASTSFDRRVTHSFLMDLDDFAEIVWKELDPGYNNSGRVRP